MSISRVAPVVNTFRKSTGNKESRYRKEKDIRYTTRTTLCLRSGKRSTVRGDAQTIYDTDFRSLLLRTFTCAMARNNGQPAQPAQAMQMSYAPRLRQYSNSLAQPILVTQAIPTGRTTKRGTTVINYADDAYDDDDFDDSETSRRPTGLRSIRREELEKKEPVIDKLGKEIHQPTEVQPIFRPWIADSLRNRRPPYEVPLFNVIALQKLMHSSYRTLQGTHAQAQLPLTLIPIRIEYEIPPHQLDTPFPIPQRAVESGLNLALPAFRRPELSPGYKIRDVFTWNLHEALSTPEDFAITFVQDLDLPPSIHGAAIAEVSKQIRTQLEEYAGVALHPLFHPPSKVQEAPARAINSALQKVNQNGQSTRATPRPLSGQGTPMREWGSGTPRVGTPGPAPDTPLPTTLPNGAQVTAEATPVPVVDLEDSGPPINRFLNPDDTYRCVITLSVYHASRLFQDKFEWSLLHPVGVAEAFAKQTAADMGLNGEWVLAISHAIYEAVLRLKKEMCEGSNVAAIGGVWGLGNIDNQAVKAEEGAGWRYDEADFGAEWEPRIELLSKEEIEKREGDRERQLRRLRRETAKFTSTTGMTPTAREQEAQQRGSYFDLPGGPGDETPMMGRGERNRKKRRLRSPSPSAKEGTPAEPDSGWGGDSKTFAQETDRISWRCTHCLVWGTAVWAVRNGPKGPRVSWGALIDVMHTNSSTDSMQQLWFALRTRQGVTDLDEGPAQESTQSSSCPSMKELDVAC